MTLREYERTSALLRGLVPVRGADITFVPFEIDNFRRMLRYLEYDISEMSMSSYLIARESGVPFTAIPVFPHRRFRHSYIFVRNGSGIKEPRDLIGKKIGIPEYQITALLWIRGTLLHDYDVRPENIRWFFDREEERVPIKLPDKISIQKIEATTKEQLIREGKLDAIIDAKVPKIFYDADSCISRLFPDYKEVERKYYQRTGIFPIMHTIVAKEQLFKDNPWLAVSLWKAFVHSKQISFQRMKDARLSNFVWPESYVQEEGKIFGDDPWKYNLKDNRKNLETLIDYSLEQYFISKRQEVDDIFFPNTLELEEDKSMIPYDL